MALNIGKQFIKGQRVAVHAPALESINATDYQPTGYLFSQASIEEVDAAAQAAEAAFVLYSQISQEQRAGFLDEIAVEIEALGASLQ